MIVGIRERNESNLGLVVLVGDELVVQFNDTFLPLDTHKEDMTYSMNRDLDIMSVREVDHSGQIIRSELINAKIIRERSEEAEITETEDRTIIKVPKGVEFEFKTK